MRARGRGARSYLAEILNDEMWHRAMARCSAQILAAVSHGVEAKLGFRV